LDVVRDERELGGCGSGSGPVRSVTQVTEQSQVGDEPFTDESDKCIAGFKLGISQLKVIELVMVPSGPGKYRAMLGSLAITKQTRQPLFDGARALLALGYDPAGMITARHAGRDIIAMRATIGEAACWTIEESDKGGLRKRLWMPRSPWGGSPETADAPEVGQPDPVAVLAVVLPTSEPAGPSRRERKADRRLARRQNLQIAGLDVTMRRHRLDDYQELAPRDKLPEWTRLKRSSLGCKRSLRGIR
jgi:hypothetical protein